MLRSTDTQFTVAWLQYSVIHWCYKFSTVHLLRLEYIWQVVTVQRYFQLAISNAITSTVSPLRFPPIAVRTYETVGTADF